MYPYLLFDLDGTLTDSKPGIINCVRYALDAEHYTDYDDAFLNQFIGPPLMDSFQQFCHFDTETATRATEKYRERFSTIGIYENAVYDGVIPMLKALKEKGCTIALATSKPEHFARTIIQHFHLAPYIDYPVGATVDGTREKKADVIAEALRQLQANPLNASNCAMIGDRFYDINGAKEWNLLAVGCRWGYAEPEELERAGADYIAETPNDLISFLG